VLSRGSLGTHLAEAAGEDREAALESRHLRLDPRDSFPSRLGAPPRGEGEDATGDGEQGESNGQKHPEWRHDADSLSGAGYKFDEVAPLPSRPRLVPGSRIAVV